MRRWLIPAVLLVLAACGGDSEPLPTAPPTQVDFVTIDVNGIAYPDSVSIPSDRSIKFVNNSGVGHTVTFDTMNGEPFELDFDLATNAELGFELDPGTYEYFCSIHPVMQGELVVGG